MDWVRDRADADVHLLLTSQGSGSGGSEITLTYVGRRALAGRGDTLRVDLPVLATEEQRRQRMTRAVAMGLMQFVARTPAADLVRISSIADAGQPAAAQAPVSDPWRAWVFEVGANGGMGGERAYRSRRINADFNARRVTDAWKFDYTFDYQYGDQRATVQDFDSAGQVTSEETFTNLQRNWDADVLLVRSVSQHWSLGLRSSYESNTFRNFHRSFDVAPAVELNVFPYRESTRREFVFRYGTGVRRNTYVETTIYDRLSESLPFHYLESSYRTREEWGGINLTARHRNYLNDGSKRNTHVSGNVNVRLFRGLGVRMSGYYDWIRDQIYLPKGGQDAVDVLLRRRALQTGFDYGMNAGLSYTFGSIFNNVVNPRF